MFILPTIAGECRQMFVRGVQVPRGTNSRVLEFRTDSTNKFRGILQGNFGKPKISIFCLEL